MTAAIWWIVLITSDFKNVQAAISHTKYNEKIIVMMCESKNLATNKYTTLDLLAWICILTNFDSTFIINDLKNPSKIITDVKIV